MSLIRNTVKVACQSTRQVSTTAVRPKGEIHEGYFKLKDIQARFQKNDGKPVHLKGGTMDTVMYYTTFALSGAGVVGAAHLFYSIIYPKSA